MLLVSTGTDFYSMNCARLCVTVATLENSTSHNASVHSSSSNKNAETKELITFENI